MRRRHHERRDRPLAPGRHDRDGDPGNGQGPAGVRRAVPDVEPPGHRERRHDEPGRGGDVSWEARLLSPRVARGVRLGGEVADPPGAGPRDRGDAPVKAGHDHDAREHHGKGMRPLRALVSLDEAMSALMALAVPIARTEVVALPEALHRVAAKDSVSSIHVPLVDRAAMDGYAVRAADTYRAGKLRPAPCRKIATLSATS